MNPIGYKSVSVARTSLALLILFATPAHAQHGDWLMGTDGLLSGQQAPQGMYYSNIWSYYHASGSDFAEIGPLKCGPRDRVAWASTWAAMAVSTFSPIRVPSFGPHRTRSWVLTMGYS